MDFSEILDIAANNSGKQSVVKRYSTEVSSAKKLQRGNVQSDAIKAFLRRKEQEEKRKAVDAARKKEELLNLRAAAKHNRRASAMARRTKDNNFAAKFEERNENVISDKLPEKPISSNEMQSNIRCRQVVDEFEDRVSSKNGLNYKSCERNKPLSISEKETVKQRKCDSSLSKSPLPRVKHEYKSSCTIEEPENSTLEKKKTPVPSKSVQKSSAPQRPVDFFTLLKIAKEKHKEPVNIPKRKPVDVEERPMTREEKERFLEEAERKMRKSYSIPKKTPEIQSKSEQGEKKRIPKVLPSTSKRSSDHLVQENAKAIASKQVQPSSRVVNNHANKSKAMVNNNNCVNKQITSKPIRTPDALNSKRTENSIQPSLVDKKNSTKDLSLQKKSSTSLPPASSKGLVKKNSDSRPSKSDKQSISQKGDTCKSFQGNDKKPNPQRPLNQRSKNEPPSLPLPAKQISSRDKPVKPLMTSQGKPTRPVPTRDGLPKKLPPDTPVRQFPPRDTPVKQFPPRDTPVKQFPPRDTPVRQFPPRDIPVRHFPPRDVSARQFPPRDVHSFKRPRGPTTPMKKRPFDDDDDEEDDMDDFIDDGPCEELEDYSKHIREIFGYDRRKYLFDTDEDLDNMESSFTQQMKEEAYSARMGLLEDLEDIKREEQEMKAMKIGKKKRRIR